MRRKTERKQFRHRVRFIFLFNQRDRSARDREKCDLYSIVAPGVVRLRRLLDVFVRLTIPSVDDCSLPNENNDLRRNPTSVLERNLLHWTRRSTEECRTVEDKLRLKRRAEERTNEHRLVERSLTQLN